MNLEQMKARLEEIVAELEKFEGVDNLSNEQIESINSLSEEFDGLKGNIEAQEKVQAMRQTTKKSTRKVAPKATPKVEVIDRHEKTGGFASYGEFAKSVYNMAHGKMDDRFQNATMFEQVSEDGGILVPEEFKQEIKTKFDSQDSLLARTFSMSVSGNSLGMPIDEEQPWNSGVQAYWTAEGAPITSSKSKLSEANFRLHKIAALVKVNEELLEDSSAIESLIRKKAPNAMVSKVNNAIISGDGVGKPTGLLSSGFKIAVAPEGGQAVDTVVYKNIIKMESRLIPGSNAVWIANPAVKEQLRQLKDDNGNHIYMAGAQFPNLSEAGFDTLLGKPVVYMMGATRALGDEGDLILADLSYYYTLVKGGIKSDMSTHLYFDRDQTAFKFTMRLDGHCPFSSPVQTEYGAYDMSAIITLQDR